MSGAMSSIIQHASKASLTPSGGFYSDFNITKSFVVSVLKALTALSKCG